jgi:hypothetical protein
MSRSLLELSDYLVGHWELSKDFKDSSGNDNDGTPTNIEWKPTSRGFNPSFDGSGYVDIPYKNVGNDITYSMWWSTASTSSQTLISYMKTLLRISSSEVRWWANTSESSITISKSIEMSTMYHIVITQTSSNGYAIYLNGVSIGSGNTSAIDTSNNSNQIGSYLSGVNFNGNISDVRIYSTPFDSTEALDLYNATKETYGVTYAERSYSHNLSPEITDDTVFATDMSTKNASGTLVDLSGNSNHGNVIGATRDGGYFTNGMEFGGVSDYVNIGELSFGADTDFHVVMVFSSSDTNANLIDSRYAYQSSYSGYALKIGIGEVIQSSVQDGVTKVEVSGTTTVTSGILHVIEIDVDRDGLMSLYLDGALEPNPLDISSVGNIDSSLDWLFSVYYGGGAYECTDCNVKLISINECTQTSTQVKQRFNSIADLCLFSCDFSEMSSNTTVYTDVLPYSSAIIKSGSFKLDNGIICVTDGQLTLRCAHDFDGSEEINFRSTPDNLRLAYGTGSVSYGDIDASISQGSSLITLDMLAGDTLDKLDIQFREHLGC